MGAFKGSLVLLKIGDGATPVEQFTTLGGLRTTRLSINRQPVNVQDVTGQGWRVALEKAGVSSLRVQGEGIFTSGEAGITLQELAISGAVRKYHFYFGNGDRLESRFIVTSYERIGTVNGLEAVNLTLENSGVPEYIEA